MEDRPRQIQDIGLREYINYPGKYFMESGGGLCGLSPFLINVLTMFFGRSINVVSAVFVRQVRVASDRDILYRRKLNERILA